MTKLNRPDFHSIQLLVLVGIFGIATAYVSKIALVVGAGLFVMGFLQILKTRNAGGIAHLFAGLIVGSEVYIRMSYTGLPWEFGKISVVILLLTGMMVERQSRKRPQIYILYGIFLFPAIFVLDYISLDAMKKELLFNLSGHACLIVSIFYFYNRKMNVDDLAKLGKYLVYGVVLMSALLFIKVPEYGTIRYGGGSNHSASGGFGPNQVAAILGLGMMILGYFILTNKRLFTYKIVDIGLLSVFTLQGLFTLSRGGVMTVGIALITGIIILYLFNASQLKSFINLNFLKVGIVSVVVIIAFISADQISGGAVGKRYFNVDEYGHQIKADYSTHRLEIIEADLETFSNNLATGAGIGGSRANRMRYAGISAVHVEFSRMLADHGVLGLMALLILITYPTRRFFYRKDVPSRFVLVVFVVFALATMSHNAMRLALPGFTYGLAFIYLYTSHAGLAIRRND